MAACEAGCGREALEGRVTCGTIECVAQCAARDLAFGLTNQAADGQGPYEAEASDLLKALQARAVFVLVLNGCRGSDYSLQFTATDVHDAELWGRRVASQLRRAIAVIEDSLDVAPESIGVMPGSEGPEH